MKYFLLSASCIFVTGLFIAVNAQTVEPPPVADNATPIDNTIKMRSVELERVKMEAEKSATLRREDGKELKFSLVKNDFEGIQKEQMLIIEAYTMGKEINYPQISKSSDKITEMAIRLRGNVFFTKTKVTKDEASKDPENPYAGKSVRDLIIALDNAIGEVVENPMWQKLAVVDPDTSKSVDESLVKVINASSALWIESRKFISK